MLRQEDCIVIIVLQMVKQCNCFNGAGVLSCLPQIMQQLVQWVSSVSDETGHTMWSGLQ